MGFSILDPKQQGDAAARAGRCALTVMAKAPRPGRVKTRLSPPLTPEQAAALNTCFLRDTAACLAEVSRLEHAAPIVSYTPRGDEALFDGILPAEFSLVLQRGDGFGERLLYSAEDLFACGFGSVCLIDSDSPTVPQSAYRQAVQALAEPGDRVVLGASADGGYYLIGMTHARAQLFDGITWSTASVYEETVQRARNAGFEVVELPVWYDVDDAPTLSMLRAELLAGIAPGFALMPGYAAPHTRTLLEQMDELPTAVLQNNAASGGAADIPVEAAQRPLAHVAGDGGSTR